MFSWFVRLMVTLLRPFSHLIIGSRQLMSFDISNDDLGALASLAGVVRKGYGGEWRKYRSGNYETRVMHELREDELALTIFDEMMKILQELKKMGFNTRSDEFETGIHLVESVTGITANYGLVREPKDLGKAKEVLEGMAKGFRLSEGPVRDGPWTYARWAQKCVWDREIFVEDGQPYPNPEGEIGFHLVGAAICSTLGLKQTFDPIGKARELKAQLTAE